MRISLRQITKEAGPKERKRAGGINFEHVRSNLSAGGEEVPRSAIDLALSDESNLLINNEKLNLIEKLNLNDEKNLNEHEKYMFIVGSAITSDSLGEADGKINKIKEYFRTNHQLNAGSLNLNLQDLYDLEKIKNIFNEKYKEIEEWAKKVEAESERSRSSGYISNDVVYDFGDGWKVVYIPAVGEIEPYPGIPGTSHDRIMEGNKNGLCLGSDLKYYQDNSQGKIYSVRDEDNSPRVTIRIHGNSLQEAKGKKNNPPDVDGAIHATKWFDTLQDLSYANSLDFRRFPPTKIEIAIDEFSRNNNSPYYNRWVSAWYKNGIPELDEDVRIKLEEKDPLLFQSGMGKTHFDLVKPVVQFWCKKYAENPSFICMKIIFGSRAELPEHEVFKTYRKLPEMQLAVKQLSEQDPEWFFKIGLQEFPEYREFSAFPIRVFASNNSVEFLKNFSDKEWAKNEDLIEHVIDICLSEDLTEAGFVKEFYNKEFAKPYIYNIARRAIDCGELSITSSEDKIRDQDWFDIDLLRFAYSSLFDFSKFDFTILMVDDKDRYKIAEDPYIKKKIHHVAKRFSEENPQIIALHGEFFSNLGFKDIVINAFANYFKSFGFSYYDSNRFIEKYNNSGWLNEDDKDKIFKLTGLNQNNITSSFKKQKSLTKLSMTLQSIGLIKEAEEIKNLQTIPDWLREWRDTMKHYGFQNFGRDTKWWKGKSHLEEPLDKSSAEHDIHMVEQAHMPDAQGRRISNDSLDSFMKEFYGESITIAPREGWRSKMSSLNTDYYFLKKIASELKDSILNRGKIILRDTGDILMAGLVYEGSIIGRIKAELVGSADGIDVVNEVTDGPLWLIHRDIEEEYRGLGLIKELLVSIHEYIEHNGGATIVYGVVSEQAKENTIKLSGFEKIPVTVIDFGNKKYILNRNKEDILDYFSLNGGLRIKSFVRMIDDEGYIDGAISDPFYSTNSSFYSKWKASIKSGYILRSSGAESKIKIENI